MNPDCLHAGFPDAMPGLLIAFEGLDQSGKQTQAERLRAHLRIARTRTARCCDFPDYETAIGQEIDRALHGERDYAADVMQLLYVANRYEQKPQIERWLGENVDRRLRSLPGVERRLRRSAGARSRSGSPTCSVTCRRRR